MRPSGNVLVLIIVVLGGTFFGGNCTFAQTVLPTAAESGIRDLHNGDGPFLLTFLAIKNPTEDRTVLEFDVSGLPPIVPTTTLDLPLENSGNAFLDTAGGVIDVSTFFGNGTITASDFYSGLYFGSVNQSVPTSTEHLDVTAAVQAAVTAGQHYLGFQLSTLTTDRYFLGDIVGLPDPTLTVAPEPTSAALAGIALCSLFSRRARPAQRK